MALDDSHGHAHEGAPRVTSPRIDHGIRIAGGEVCYLCEQPLRDGDPIVLYSDTAFWQQSFLYHRGCWEDAELGAKEDAAAPPVAARAIVLPDVRCARCGDMIQAGQTVVRLRAGARIAGDRIAPSLVPRVFHDACFEQARR